MPLQLRPPVIETFDLEETDKAYNVTGTTCTIKQATQEGQEARAKLWSSIVREMAQDQSYIRLVQQFSFEELKRIEVQLTLAGCNITDEDGNPLFAFNGNGIKDEISFRRAWGKLPPLVANEIHDKVLKVNIDCWFRQTPASRAWST